MVFTQMFIVLKKYHLFNY